MIHLGVEKYDETWTESECWTKYNSNTNRDNTPIV